MVIIRLSRSGTKKRPFYEVIVTNSRNKRDGKSIDRLGFFNPLAKGQEEKLNLNLQRISHWINHGAQLSDRVRMLIKQAKNSN